MSKIGLRLRNRLQDPRIEQLFGGQWQGGNSIAAPPAALSAAICHGLGAVSPNGGCQRIGHLLAPFPIEKQLFVFRIGEETEFQQH